MTGSGDKARAFSAKADSLFAACGGLRPNLNDKVMRHAVLVGCDRPEVNAAV
jgi:hypothetical protein